MLGSVNLGYYKAAAAVVCFSFNACMLHFSIYKITLF